VSTIYLFRHGQTEYNLNKRFTGWTDVALTDIGRASAAVTRDHLASKTINISFQTRLSRSQETLKIVLEPHKECKQIFTDDRLIERSYGDLEGEYHQNVIDKLGLAQYEHWHRGFYDAPPAGESFADVENRVGEFISDLIRKYSTQKLGIAISAHSNSIRLFRKIMEDASEKNACAWVIPYDSYFEYTI
jgi:broad specificity phosphatase PhoE